MPTELEMWFQRGVQAYERAAGPARPRELENARAAFEQALALIRVPNNVWAALHLNLGYVYLERLTGDVAENIETARRHFLQAERVYTADGFPREWLAIQMKLAGLYLLRLEGDWRENIEAAIACAENALSEFVSSKKDSGALWQEDHPDLYAEVLLYQGQAYRQRTLGDPRRNWQEAKLCLERAAQLSKTNAPSIWAKTQIELGHLYSQAADDVTQLLQAVQHYRAALQVLDAENASRDWGLVNYGLANCYVHLAANADPAQAQAYKQLARECFQKCQTVFSSQVYPREWVLTQLGLVSDLPMAIANYRRILQDFSHLLVLPEVADVHWRLARWLVDHPSEQFAHLKAARALFAAVGLYAQSAKVDQWWGDVLWNRNDPSNALRHYLRALASLERLRAQSYAEGSRQDVIGAWESLFQAILRASQRLKQSVSGFNIVERSRARYMLDQLAASPTLLGYLRGYDEYRELTAEVRALEHNLISRNWQSDSKMQEEQFQQYLMRALDLSRKQLAQVKTRLRSRNPRWFGESAVITFEETQACLRNV